MRRSRFLLRAVPGEARRKGFLGSLEAIGATFGASVKHPRWTSYGALEVDVFAPSAQDFETFVAAVEPLSKVEFTRSLDEPPRFQAKEEIFAEAVRYFNSERYWECHEALESVWRPAKGMEKLLVQAIILVCAAQVHQQRGESDVALSIYRRALPQLTWEEESYYGINVPRLRKQVEDGLTRGVVSPIRVEPSS